MADIGNSDRFLDVIGLIYRAPRTCRELVDLTGSKDDTIRKYGKKLVDEGLVEVKLVPDIRRRVLRYHWIHLQEQAA